MSTFRNMSTINVGIFTGDMEFNVTAYCLQHQFESAYRGTCIKKAGVDPTDMGTLLFFQVGQSSFLNCSSTIQISIQGLKSTAYQIDDIAGALLDNGTWTGTLGQLQSGIIDTWAVGTFVTLERSSSFIYTSPYIIDKYGALMKRQTTTFAIETKSVTAGIRLTIYALLLAFLLANFLISYFNEQLQPKNRRNSIWDLLLSLFPSHGKEWPNQFGVTRKILMLTSGFGILILTSFYQAKQAEVLMIPVLPPMFTLRDIEHAVASHSSKLLFNHEGSPTLNYVKRVSESLSNSLKSNPPLFSPNVSSKIDTINTKNAICIDSEGSLLKLLSQIVPNSCKNYAYIPFDEWTRMFFGLMMRKERVDI